jgi:orotidine-5'-phosphate decarboxylase
VAELISTAASPSPKTVRQVTPIVALDVPEESTAARIVATLADLCRFYKVGAELFTAAGPAIVRGLTSSRRQVFLDLKFHDIPNTVRNGCRQAARAGARIVTVHAAGGVDMMEAAVEGARAGSAGAECEVFAVTVLTSLDAARLTAVWGRPDVDVAAEVVRLAGLAKAAGVGGIVCGGGEVARVKATYGDTLAVLVPGVRLAGSAVNDQQRATTAGDAAAAGADYVVVGRTVTGAPDLRQAMERVLREVR